MNRAKFNDVVGELAAKFNFNVLNVMGCNTNSHFNGWGNLSPKGKVEFWLEIDELLEKFDKKQIKLQPFTKNQKKKHYGNDKKQRRYSDYED